jgi:predicted enzyme related to lactoylglutathione lyase
VSHGVVHFEIPADDPEKLVDFYRNVFDWKIEKMPMGGDMDYWTLSTVPTDDKGMPTEPGGINGGLMKRQAPEQGLVNYINVESVDEYAAKAKAAGATVIVEKMAVPRMGYFAQLIDPQGNPFGIWQTDDSAA